MTFFCNPLLSFEVDSIDVLHAAWTTRHLLGWYAQILAQHLPDEIRSVMEIITSNETLPFSFVQGRFLFPHINVYFHLL